MIYEAALTKILSMLNCESVKPDGWQYVGPADFLLKHGEWFREFTPAPAFKGPMGYCYGNAIIAAGRDPKLRYVEGYALKITPVHHAWVVDSETGLAHEVTWSEPGLAYLGVIFSVERADDSIWNGDASVLTDDRGGSSIYEKPWTGEDFSRVWPDSPRLKLIREGLKLASGARRTPEQIAEVLRGLETV